MQPVAKTFVDESGAIRAIPSIRVTDIMLELLDLKPTDKVLEIGTGSGTQTMLFEQCCGELHTIELRPFWKITDRLGPRSYLHSGDGIKGLPQEAPFDAIVATCGIREIPTAWRDQLKDGGRLVAPIGDEKSQKLTKFVKRDGSLRPERVGAYVRFSMMEAH